MKAFKNKNVLVTGAAGGIGRLMALAFAERGCNLMLVDLHQEGAEAVAQQIRAAAGRNGGGKAYAHALDVSDTQAIAALKKRCEAELGGIDVLVNNAGVVFGGPFEQVPLAKHLATFRVNVEGLVAMTYTFFPDLLRSRDAHIVNIASASGFIGLPNGSTYAASKWAVIGFSESIRLELAERGAQHVAVTTVCPGYIDTGMFGGVKSPIIMPLLKPDVVVAKIMKGIEENAPFVKEPFVVKTLDALRGLLPRKAFDEGTRVLGVARSMSSWKGRP